MCGYNGKGVTKSAFVHNLDRGILEDAVSCTAADTGNAKTK